MYFHFKFGLRSCENKEDGGKIGHHSVKVEKNKINLSIRSKLQPRLTLPR